MKTNQLQTKSVFRMLCITLLLLFFACSKDDTEGETPPETGSEQGELDATDGIDPDEISEYEGDIGVLVNVRSLVKKGYSPEVVAIDFGSTEGDYDAELQVDEFTNIARLSLSRGELSDAAEKELTDGVSVSITIKDNTSTTILEDTWSVVSFTENGTSLVPNDSSLGYKEETISFMETMPHFLQTVDANGNYGDKALEIPSAAGSNGIDLVEDVSLFRNSWSNHQYYFVKVSDQENTFAIYSRFTNRYLTIGNTNRFLRQSGAFTFPTDNPNGLGDDYKFIIERQSNGLYTISGLKDGNPLRRVDGASVRWHTNASGEVQYFRILALNINWDLQSLGTESLNPILPGVDTKVGFNSTLVNCTDGSLQQVVGVDESITTSRTVGWEESLSISSRETFSANLTVGVEAEANFFGGSATASAEVSASYEYSQEVTNTQTQFGEETEEKELVLQFERTVTVPAKSASLTYDAYQTYSNVIQPFVQRVRIFASQIDPANNNLELGSLTGEEIATQLKVTNFQGVISEVGSDFVVVNIRGFSKLDNLVETETVLTPTNASCN